MILNIFKPNLEKLIFKHLNQENKDKLQNLLLEDKIKFSKLVVEKALKKYNAQNCAVAWTGGKDSTLMLWLIKETAKKLNTDIPKIMFVDEGDVFPEILKFIKKYTNKWQLNFSVAHNFDVSSKAKKIGDLIKVNTLNKTNKKELKKLGFNKKEFNFEPESLVGNHLMKTVATNIWLKKNNKKALFVGVRWDEQQARSEDDFIRKIDDPAHIRVEPILHFREKDIWKAIHKLKVPYVNLYKKGFRSLGAKSTTKKAGNKPAWEQDLKNTKERQGRQQDKEAIMARLRALGYM
jgi:phosphoadenosine phosphosulfate reductase